LEDRKSRSKYLIKKYFSFPFVDMGYCNGTKLNAFPENPTDGKEKYFLMRYLLLDFLSSNSNT